ncbi:MAG: hypothetical protein GX417_12360 [Clostridiales bacterium]|nr:hypothetical protein [Clostridiales bacterium]
MSNRNRAIAILLAALTALLLTACRRLPDAAGLVTPTPTASPTAVPTAAPTAVPTATPEPTARPTPYREIMPITFGLSDTNSYQNEYFDVAIDLNDKWFAGSTLQLDLENEFPMKIPNALRREEYLEYLRKGSAVEEYHAYANTGLKEISVIVSDISSVIDQYSSLAEYHDADIALIRVALINMGATILQDDHTTAMFAGREQSCWYFAYENDGYVTYNAQVLLQNGDYCMNVYVNSIIKDQVPNVLSMFRPMSE